MPVSPCYSWEQSDEVVTVRAQCKGVSASSTNVFSSPCYVSFNAPPYFLELDLSGRIDTARSTAAVRRDEVTLRLVKEQPGAWAGLLVDLAKPARLARRAESRAEAERDSQAQIERKKKKEWEDSRYTLQKQMDKDRDDRMRIEQRIADEKKAEADKIASWQASIERQNQSKTSAKVPSTKVPSQNKSTAFTPSAGAAAAAQRNAGLKPAWGGDEPPPLRDGELADLDEEPRIVEIWPEEAKPPVKTSPQESAPKNAPAPKAAEAAAEALPPPRSAAKVQIKFTPKLLPAPARSKGSEADSDLPLDPLEAPGLREGRRGEGDISQRDPAWLKARGDRFYCLRDWASAESAYNHVLAQFGDRIIGQAIDCVVMCHSNRAACRLHRGQHLAAAKDCSDALGIMSKARCVTEFPRSETALARCRLRLFTRRAAAYAHAGVLHRAVADLSTAQLIAAPEGTAAEPSLLADQQMLAADVQLLQKRRSRVLEICSEADELLAAHQPAAAAAEAAAEPLAEGEAREALGKALGLYGQALTLQPLEVGTLANRAACQLWLSQPLSCVTDATKGLQELDAEEVRAEDDRRARTGLFPSEAPPAEVMEECAQLAQKAELQRFELLRRRAAGHTALAQFADAAADLRGALKLRPGEPQVVHALDGVARRAAAAGVDLEPLPPAMPELAVEEVEDGDEQAHADADADADADAAAAGGEVGGEGDAAVVGDGSAAGGAAARSSKPAVGTRSAPQLKADADGAFQAGKLERAVGLYAKAMQTDAAAEWLEGAQVGGLHFRCQCLANRAACHLKLRDFKLCIEDAGAALTALSASPTQQGAALRLKLLARRGMAHCQLQQYEDAHADYSSAVELDPENEQLKHDLAVIAAARGSAV